MPYVPVLSTIHDWNRTAPAARPLVVDETLRDGLQSASVRDPPLEQKISLLHAMCEIGVEVVSLGLPAAGARALHDATELAREIAAARLTIKPTAAARTLERDIQLISDVSLRVGIPIEIYAFVGSSPIRQFVEGWDLAFLLERVRAAGAAAREAELPLCLAMEDTTRTPPNVLTTLFEAAVDAGALRLCLCDTVGHADTHGVRALVEFVRGALSEIGAPHVELDWHGHNDRGLALPNALAAARAGVHRVHGTALGIGERTGNTPMEDLVANLAARGARDPVAKEALDKYRALASAALGGPTLASAEAHVSLAEEWVFESPASPGGVASSGRSA